jgi:O-acetyl-ADP-ribose deacetylase (regulator of RNase III)
LGGEAWALLRLTLPAPTPGSPEPLLRVGLDYRDLDGHAQHCEPATLPLRRLPTVLLAAMPEDETVATRVRELELATLQERARQAARAHDWDTVATLLDELRLLAMDRAELRAIVAELQSLYDERDAAMFSKESLYSSRRLRQRLIAREDLQVAEAASHFRLKGAQGRAAPVSPSRPPAQVTVVAGDITTQPDCQGIVNSAHRSLGPGGGVCGAIHRAAGPELAAHCQGLGPVPPGRCVMTPGFRLPNRFVLHTVVPELTIAGSAAFNRLGRCLQAVLEMADAHGLQRIAVPALGLGERGYPADRAIPTLVETAQRMAAGAQHLEEIRFVAADTVTLAGFQAVLGAR